jgi:hypothetical protein
MPRDSPTVLKIDTTNDTVSEFGSVVGTGKYIGGVLGTNNCIYGIPRNAGSILKIDTEGFDLGVLDGAKDALKRNQVNVILFEYNTFWPAERRGEPPLKAIVEDLADYGYVCWLEGKNSMIRLTQCWSDTLAKKQWSNIYCASVQRVPAIVQALDSYSLAFNAA